MQQAKHEQLVKNIERKAGEKMSENQITRHIAYSKACHKLEQRMQVCQKRNPVMLVAEDKTQPTDVEDHMDPLSVQEMKELKIFRVIRVTPEASSSCSSFSDWIEAL